MIGRYRIQLIDALAVTIQGWSWGVDSSRRSRSLTILGSKVWQGTSDAKLIFLHFGFDHERILGILLHLVIIIVLVRCHILHLDAVELARLTTLLGHRVSHVRSIEIWVHIATRLLLNVQVFRGVHRLLSHHFIFYRLFDWFGLQFDSLFSLDDLSMSFGNFEI